jgi:hypothetical protein
LVVVTRSRRTPLKVLSAKIGSYALAMWRGALWQHA